MSFATPSMSEDAAPRAFSNSDPATDYVSGLQISSGSQAMSTAASTSFPINTNDTLQMHIHAQSRNSAPVFSAGANELDTKALALNIARRYHTNASALNEPTPKSLSTHQHRMEPHTDMHLSQHSEGLLDHKMHLGQHREGLLDHKMHLGQHREGLLDHKMHLGQHREGLLDHKMHIQNQHFGLMSQKEAVLNIQAAMNEHSNALKTHNEAISQLKSGVNSSPADVDALRRDLGKIATAVQAQQRQLTEIHTTARADKLHMQSCMQTLAADTDKHFKTLSRGI